MLIRRRMIVERDPDAVFALISDPDRYREFFAGLTGWTPRSERRRGRGARYRVLMRVGSIDVGSTIEVTGWEPGRLIEWSADEGLELSGRWSLAPRAGGTEVALEVEYGLSGGPVGRLVERLSGRMVGMNVTSTLLAVRRLVEQETPA